MSRSPLFAEFARALRIARFCNDHRLSTADGLARVREAEFRHAAARRSRRDVLKTLAAAGAAATLSPVDRLLAMGQKGGALDVGIVGAGLAGLACADTLAGRGIGAQLYDANTRTGGRCVSLRDVFPGQTAEGGGEFIDNLHKTMLGYAKRFGLAKEDVTKEPGDIVYFFGGEFVPESAVVDEFRDFVAAMRVDLRTLSGAVTALSHTPDDVELDNTSLLAYLQGQNGAGVSAGPIAAAALGEAYLAEYGLELDEQSCLNFLFFIHADRRSKFTPFGTSDERYHLVDGNDGIVDGLTQALLKPVELGMHLVAVRRLASGRIELTFESADGPQTRTHDAVVLAIPFTTLQSVSLHTNLNLSLAKRAAISDLGYGMNAKMMIGFNTPIWRAHASNGSAYTDLDHVQTTWETNAARATASRAVLTDYSGGDRGAALDPHPLAVQAEANLFLADLNVVYPGANAAARRIGGNVVAHLEHWPSNPLTLGSYTCYRPGQFTTIAGLEGLPAGNLFFAGEHANSFHEWQGFMEGAVLSGIDAAKAILR